jgi:hypothetical protein
MTEEVSREPVGVRCTKVVWKPGAREGPAAWFPVPERRGAF